MTQTLRWGIISTGNIAHTFARGLPHAQYGELAAVASRTKDSAEKFGAEFGLDAAHCYASYQELLDSDEIDAVYIATPHPQHAEWAIKAAEAGKHILCEKPLTLNVATALAVVDAARRSDVFLMEAFMYRCHPQTLKLVELIRDGAIGEVNLIVASFAFDAGPNIEGRTLNHASAGGGILDVGCYPVSFSRLVAGAATGQEIAEPLQVRGVARIGEESRVDEIAAATLLFPNGIVAQCATGVRTAAENNARVFGSKGDITVLDPWIPAKEGGTTKLILTSDGQTQEIEIETTTPLYALEADAFAEGVESGRAPYPAMSIEDTLGNMRTLDLWRAEIGLTYDMELPAATSKTVRGEALRVQQNTEHPMKFGRVNGVEKDVSRLVMGTMLEGATQPMQHGFVMYDEFVEQGGNCFDTAYVYGGGEREKIFGAWLKSRGAREDVVVIGKGAHTPHCNPTDLVRELDESLERLQLDGVDIYMMHRDNLDIPAGEFVEVLNKQLQAGKLRAFGGSNWSLERVEEANAYAAAKGLRGFECISNNLSLARMVDPVWAGCIMASDPDSRAWFEREQMPLFSWSSQARGFFVRADPDFQSDEELVRCWYAPDNFARLERVQKMAKERSVSPINIALAYVLCQPFPAFALIGPRSPEELRTSLPGLSVELSPEDLKFLNGE